MDTAVLPNPASFTADRDGGGVVLSNPVWALPQVLQLDYTGVAPVTSGSVNLIAQDPNLRCAIGTLADPPQSVPYFP